MPTFNPEVGFEQLLGNDLDQRLGPWHEGGHLIVGNNARLPGRCVKCNAPAAIPMQRRRFIWHPTLLYALALFNLIIYAIAVALVRKNIEVTMGLCATHERKRKWRVAAKWLGVGVALIVAFAGPTPIWLLYGLAVLLLALGFGHWFARPLVPVHVGDHFARFRGCSREFLESLPRFQR
jgi:hypothetical protein